MKKHDLRESGKDELFKIVQRTYALTSLYNTETSLVKLRKKVDGIFEYTQEQWEQVEVNFKEDLEARYL